MKISQTVDIPEEEIQMVAVRAQGPGGQNVNKVSSAIQLFFNIRLSSLPEGSKEKLLRMHDSRITNEGVVVIKAQTHRSQEKNREEARNRLKELIQSTLLQVKKRKSTRPSRAAKERRIDQKKQHSRNKDLRRNIKP